jgi:AdoMet-dependent heme synthase
MQLNFDDQPRLVFWEMTKACPLACVHCRATAQPDALPGELTTAEGRDLIDEMATAPRPRPILILTGGDCLSRPDLVELAGYAHHVGVPVAIAPSVSSRMTPALLGRLRDQGVANASVSLDGSTPGTHEGIRSIPGHFEETLDAIALLASEGFHVQVNTAVMSRNVAELADLAALLHRSGVSVWEVFFLINVGRAGDIEELSPAEAEDVCHFLVDAAQHGMIVRTVEAPFFRRVQRERAASPGHDAAEAFSLGPLYRNLSAQLRQQLGPPTSRVLAPTIATRDGKGIIFVSHDGDVFPSGFLPLSLGNVRTTGLLSIYRDHPVLRALRGNDSPLPAGTCEYRDLCGGSRARAYAATGDILADDPACIMAGPNRRTCLGPSSEPVAVTVA